MSENQKLFSQADEFDFKRRFVIEFLAIQAINHFNAYFHTNATFELSKVDNALAMADRVWETVVEHGVNE